MKFRFEDMEIWNFAIEIGEELFAIADEITERKNHSFAEQLYSTGMQISNNIAEGSGAFSNKEFADYLNMARRSIFECVNVIVLMQRRSLISDDKKEQLTEKLDKLSRMITNFRKNLLK